MSGSVSFIFDSSSNYSAAVERKELRVCICAVVLVSEHA